MRRAVYFLFLLWIATACISDFSPDVEGVRDILVVDGVITDGESLIRLTYSVGIVDTLRGDNIISNASMCVERSDGTLFDAQYEGNGNYRIQTGDLDLNLEYRLNFSIGNKLYQSSFLKPIQTVEIDSLSYRKEGIGKPVAVYVSSNGGDNSSIYYRWNYRETWELQAPLFARQGYVNGVLTEFNPRTPMNTYYCWGRDSSKMLLLETSKGLSENVIYQKKLYEIPCSNEKLSILYHVEVSQMQLREEAYNYFRILQDEIERTGGLFNLVMSAGDNGNIYCLSDPDEIIVGYVEVTNTTKKGMYITHDRFDLLYESPEDHCWIREDGDPNLGLPWVNYWEKTYATWYCVDCRMHYNASKNKPSWWPTEHL